MKSFYNFITECVLETNTQKREGIMEVKLITRKSSAQIDISVEYKASIGSKRIKFYENLGYADGVGELKEVLGDVIKKVLRELGGRGPSATLNGLDEQNLSAEIKFRSLALVGK